MCASVTSAMATSAWRRTGAVPASQRARPPSATRRPRPSVTVTVRRLLSGSTVRFVRLDDLLHQLVAHDVLVVEPDERDALDVADDLHRFDQARRAAGGQIDLGNVAGNHR